VLLPDTTNVNCALAKDSLCWWYRNYAPGDMALEGIERDAREGRKGVWADPQPVPPGSGGKEMTEESSKTHLFCSILLMSPMS